jgi:hypothetical protein
VTIEEIIAALEKATVPDCELEYEVLLACGWNKTCVGHFYGPLYRWSSPRFTHSYDQDRMPSPMQSLDMAILLVPEGRWWVLNSGVQTGSALAQVDAGKTWEHFEGHGATPAIALCIAALKARAAQS